MALWDRDAPPAVARWVSLLRWQRRPHGRSDGQRLLRASQAAEDEVQPGCGTGVWPVNLAVQLGELTPKFFLAEGQRVDLPVHRLHQRGEQQKPVVVIERRYSNGPTSGRWGDRHRTIVPDAPT